MSQHDSATGVAVVGAGPYGLSVAAHLASRALEHRIFGRPMDWWLNLPPSLGLKSHDFATNVYVPHRGYRFVDYCRAHGKSLAEPIPFALFAEYGQWVQRRLLPQVEPCQVTGVSRCDGGFQVTLETGERVLAMAVVICTGLAHWQHVPSVFARLPAELVSHSSERMDFARFRGREVTVIGAGASALEAATLIHESGAGVRLLVRGGPPVFGGVPANPRPLKERLMYPPSALGPGRKNFLLDRLPSAAHHLLSDDRRVRLTRTHLGPLGPWWLRDRFEGKVEVHHACRVAKADVAPAGVLLTIRGGGSREWQLRTDHVVCGTGYEIDVDRHPLLEVSIREQVERIVRAPRLTANFESSVPGLYFAGPGAMFSFGPLFRFVAGAAHAAPVVARHLSRRLPTNAARRHARA
ncbi:MAG TPA: NAD(P)-binding domain-containing protein [Candidatus Dormibacteraeota bacterium]|nr:NAD(P)-binding domain-containing protein [Candidatus Dormibacteraeota bacterium]